MKGLLKIILFVGGILILLNIIEITANWISMNLSPFWIWVLLVSSIGVPGWLIIRYEECQQEKLRYRKEGK